MTHPVLKDFLVYLSAEKGLSVSTLEAYQSDLDQFLIWCRVKKVEFLQISITQCRNYLVHLKDLELHTRTLARKLSSLRQFYKFLLRESITESNPMDLISVRVHARKLPHLLTVEEMMRLVKAPDGKTGKSIRDRALLELWYATGCRISEIAHLKASHLDYESEMIRVQGKGNKERLIPLTQEAIKWCLEYKTLRHLWLQQGYAVDSVQFFLSEDGKPLSRQQLWKIVKGYVKKIGIEKKVWPHMIRHSFATHILQGGADLRTVQALLGHESISTTQIYTHLDTENLKLMQLKFHPRG